jgi:hypothetical protein
LRERARGSQGPFDSRVSYQIAQRFKKKTGRSHYAFLRDKQAREDGPFTAVEAQRLRSVIDAIVSIKRKHRTATPEKRAANETLLGTEIFQDENNGLDSVSAAGAKLRDAKDKARQGQ